MSGLPDPGSDDGASGSHSELHVESIAQASAEELVELARISLGERNVPRTPDFWDWKHRQNPFGSSFGQVALSAGGLVGMRPFLRWTWRSGDTDHPAVRAVDTATHPEWRRRGVFRALTESSLEEATRRGVRFVFNTPNAKSLHGYLKMGWKRVGRAPLRVRPFRPFRSLVRLSRSRLGGGPGEQPPSPVARAAKVLSGSRVESLLGGWEREVRLHTPRGIDYLIWRYAAVPGIDYGAAVDATGGALVVYRLVRRSGLVELKICELLVGDADQAIDNGACLVRGVAVQVEADYGVAVAAGDTPEGRALARAGYLTVPTLGPVLLVRPLDDGAELPELDSWETWRLTAGDIELF